MSRPQDIIADYLARKKLKPEGRDTVDDIAIGIIEALERDDLVIDYPYDGEHYDPR